MSYLSHVPGLPELKAKHGLRVFVETGCGDGDGLRYAIDLGFEHRYSCDLNYESVKASRHLGHIMYSNSLVFLDFMLGAGFTEPTLFWLDAHFPDKFGVDGAKWPLLEELKIIAGKHKVERDVIVCDDMHCIQGDDNPTREAGPGHDWEPVEGSIAELTALFPNHVATLHQVNTGILVFEPK